MLNQTLPFIRYINRDSKTARTMNWENHLIKDLQWSNEIINREAKERVAYNWASRRPPFGTNAPTGHSTERMR